MGIIKISILSNLSDDFLLKMPFDERSAAMGFKIKEIKRQSRAVKVTHPPAGGGNFTSEAASQVQ